MNDQQITDYLRSRGQVTPPVDFVHSVMAAVDAAPTRPARFSLSVPAVVTVGAMAALSALAFLLGPGRDLGPAAASPTSPSSMASVDVDDLRVALIESVDVLRAAAGVEGRQQVEIDGIIGSATWFDWRPNGDQVVITRHDLDVTETAWWVVSGGAPPATGQRIYTNIQGTVGDEFFFITEDGAWQVDQREPPILAIGSGILDRSVVPWYPLLGPLTSSPDPTTLDGRIERIDRPDGGVEWSLESEWLGDVLINRWEIGPAGELRSWTWERDGRSVDIERGFDHNATRATLLFTIADGNAIQLPDLDVPPDPSLFGLPENFPLEPTPEPVGAVQLAECADPTGTFLVTLPEGWWTNPTFDHPVMGEQPACHFFGPAAFDPAAGDPDNVVPPGVSFTISLLEGGCIGFINPALSQRELVIDGWTATATEFAQGKEATNPPGHVQYVINLRPDDVACESGGAFIVARTAVEMTGDYEANKAILDEVMGSMEITFEGP